MMVKVVFNEPHDMNNDVPVSQAPSKEIKEARIHFLGLPAEGHRVVLDGVSYIVAGVNHHFGRSGSAPEYISEGIVILLDKADKPA